MGIVWANVLSPKTVDQDKPEIYENLKFVWPKCTRHRFAHTMLLAFNILVCRYSSAKKHVRSSRQYLHFAAIEKVCIAAARAPSCPRDFTWCIRPGPVKLLPLLGELTPHPAAPPRDTTSQTSCQGGVFTIVASSSSLSFPASQV